MESGGGGPKLVVVGIGGDSSTNDGMSEGSLSTERENPSEAVLNDVGQSSSTNGHETNSPGAVPGGDDFQTPPAVAVFTQGEFDEAVRSLERSAAEDKGAGAVISTALSSSAKSVSVLSGNEPPTKVPRINKPPIRQKKLGTPVLMPSYDSRRDKALRKGKFLVREVNDYKISTVSQSYFKSCFTYKNGSVLTYEAGEDFNLLGTQPEVPLTVEAVQESLEKTVVQTIVRTLKSSVSTPSTSRPTSSVISPRKNAPTSSSDDICHICRKEEVVDGVLVFDSRMILCSKEECTKCVHLDCIGFFVFVEDEIEKMPDYFCPDHRMEARRLHNVAHSYLEESADSSKVTTGDSSQSTEAEGPSPSIGIPVERVGVNAERPGRGRGNRGRGLVGRGRSGGRGRRKGSRGGSNAT